MWSSWKYRTKSLLLTATIGCGVRWRQNGDSLKRTIEIAHGDAIAPPGHEGGLRLNSGAVWIKVSGGAKIRWYRGNSSLSCMKTLQLMLRAVEAEEFPIEEKRNGSGSDLLSV